MKDFRYLLFLFLFATLVVSFGLIDKTFAVTADVTTLGGLSLDAYCNNLNQLNSNPINSSDWQCNPSGTKININKACQWQYNDPFAYGLQGKLSNPYTWQCFTSSTAPTATPTPTPSAVPTSTPASNKPITRKMIKVFENKAISKDERVHSAYFDVKDYSKAVLFADSNNGLSLTINTVYSIDGINAYVPFPAGNEISVWPDTFRRFASSPVKEIATPFIKVEAFNSPNDPNTGTFNVYLYLIP